MTPPTVIAILALRFAVALLGVAAMSGPRIQRFAAGEVWIGVLPGAILSGIFMLENPGSPDIGNERGSDYRLDQTAFAFAGRLILGWTA